MVVDVPHCSFEYLHNPLVKRDFPLVKRVKSLSHFLFVHSFIQPLRLGGSKEREEPLQYMRVVNWWAQFDWNRESNLLEQIIRENWEKYSK